jgi:superfamily II DNA/RNA helicase
MPKAADRKAERLEKMRSDTLRKGFNSPFWPHVLITTSIGQEGLDFHVWCDRVIHWDLPRDAVDFEQREGRIARYANLAGGADAIGRVQHAPALRERRKRPAGDRAHQHVEDLALVVNGPPKPQPLAADPDHAVQNRSQRQKPPALVRMPA